MSHKECRPLPSNAPCLMNPMYEDVDTHAEMHGNAYLMHCWLPIRMDHIMCSCRHILKTRRGTVVCLFPHSRSAYTGFSCQIGLWMNSVLTCILHVV